MRARTAIPSLLTLLAALALSLPAPGAAAEAGSETTATAPATTTTTTAPPSEGGPAGTVAEEGEATQPAATNPTAVPVPPPAKPKAKSPAPATASTAPATNSQAPKLGSKAPAPSVLTPGLPLNLISPISGVPSFFIESFQVPPFLLPIFQAAGTAYDIPWQVLAAINEVETDYGRDLSVSSAGAEGWMQFLPAEWAQYGVDANGDGYRDPYNPADAIFTAARYLRAAGGASNIRAAVFSYNHSPAYVESVMLRAELLGGTPPELLGALTGITESRFPVHAASHYSDGFPVITPSGAKTSVTVPGTTIYSQAGAPVIAVQDGQIVGVGDSPTLGRYISLRDAYGNTYTYAELGDTASVYPVLQPIVRSAVSSRIQGAAPDSERAPAGPATAGAQVRSPLAEGSTLSDLALGAAAALETAPHAAAHRAAAQPAQPAVTEFTEGEENVYLHPMEKGAEVIAGTVLGHVGPEDPATGPAHMLFQIRPAGIGAPQIDPKPILDGWVALENTTIFRARGENPFLATSPTVGQVLLESKQQLEPQVLSDKGIELSACARQDIQAGRVQGRVLAMLEYLSVSGLKPTVAGLACAPTGAAAQSAEEDSLDITAVDGVPVAGHQGPGTPADNLVRKLLMLQGTTRPLTIVSQMSYPGSAVAQTSASASGAIRVLYSAPGSLTARAAAGADVALSPDEWIRLVARLGEIPDPTVGRGPSSAALPDAAQTGTAQEGETGGNN